MMQVGMDAAAREARYPGSGQSVVGVFDSDKGAEEVIDQLLAAKLTGQDISVMMRDARETVETVTVSTGNPVLGGAATGAGFGGLLGGLLGWMIAIGAIAMPGVSNGVPAIPGVGTVLGSGVLAAFVTGLLFGGAVGGLIGALLGLRVPKEEQVQQGGPLREGRVLVTVHPAYVLDAGEIQGIMQRGGGYDIRVYDAPLELDTSSMSAMAPAQAVEAEADAMPADTDAPGEEREGKGAEGGFGDGEGQAEVENVKRET